MLLRRMPRLSLVLFAVGACCLVGGGYGYYRHRTAEPPPGPALELAETDFELPRCSAGESRDVVLCLNNRSNRPIRIVGSRFSGICLNGS